MGLDRIDTPKLNTPWTLRLSFARYHNTFIKQRFWVPNSAGIYSGICSYYSTNNHVLYTNFAIFFVGSRVRFVGGSKFRPKQNIKYDFCYFVCNV